MTTQMIQLQFANAPLFRWAAQCGIPGDDEGYVLHNALVGLFGDHRPRPFGHWNKGRHTKVLGYTKVPAQQMRAHALARLADRQQQGRQEKGPLPRRA